jgi:hypothetical protein
MASTREFPRVPLKFPLQLISIALLGWMAASSAEQMSEYSVKAVFLYNFTKFTQWPQSGQSTAFELCVMGADPFGDALATIEGKQAQGRELHVKRNVSLEEAKTCQVLFINEPEQSRLGTLLRRLEKVPVLTVGDTDGFAEAGGMIGLLMDDNRVQFEVNLKAVDKAGIKISSQLLKLARDIKGGR